MPDGVHDKGDVLAAERHLDLRMIFDGAAHVCERPPFNDGERLEYHAALDELTQDFLRTRRAQESRSARS